MDKTSYLDCVVLPSPSIYSENEVTGNTRSTLLYHDDGMASEGSSLSYAEFSRKAYVLVRSIDILEGRETNLKRKIDALLIEKDRLAKEIRSEEEKKDRLIHDIDGLSSRTKDLIKDYIFYHEFVKTMFEKTQNLQSVTVLEGQLRFLREKIKQYEITVASPTPKYAYEYEQKRYEAAVTMNTAVSDSPSGGFGSPELTAATFDNEEDTENDDAEVSRSRPRR